MKRSIIIIVGLIVLGIFIIVAVGMFKFNILNDDIIIVPPVVPVSIKDTTYVIDHKAVKLVAGVAEENIAGSTSKTTTRYFGNQVDDDFNSDGSVDSAFLLTQETGGSGIFYYLVVALKTATGYQGTNAILLGDRIAPQTTGFLNGMIVVNYGERGIGESMTTQPTVGVSRYFKVEGTALTEVQE